MNETDIRRSLVIPMYRETTRIPRTIALLAASGLNQPDTELIFVDDGSGDDTPDVAARAADQHHLTATVLRLDHNRGKGAAVALGLLNARGPARAFVDADLSADAADVVRCFELIEADVADVVVATRTHPDSRIEARGPRYRKVWGWGYNSILRAMRMTELGDTQCGLKGFSAGSAASLFSELQTDGFAFDIEVLYRAQRLGLRVVELPVAWTHVDASRVRAIRDVPKMLVDSIQVWRRLRRLPAGGPHAARAAAQPAIRSPQLEQDVPKGVRRIDA
jgi:glycosyltransferase involved in cell wall biosynthesis